MRIKEQPTVLCRHFAISPISPWRTMESASVTKMRLVSDRDWIHAHKEMLMKKISGFAAILVALASQNASAAAGEMGTGVPYFGVYSQATGTMLRVYSLGSPYINFPAGCDAIVLTPATMGMESFKIAFATLTTARISGLKVRLYAHGERDGGCGADYVQLQD